MIVKGAPRGTLFLIHSLALDKQEVLRQPSRGRSNNDLIIITRLPSILNPF